MKNDGKKGWFLMIFYSRDTVQGIFASDFTAVLQVTKTQDMIHLEI
jgi:hypothetical protein